MTDVKAVVEDGWKIYRKPGELPTRIPEGKRVPLQRDNDPSHLQPQVVADGFARMYDLSNPEQEAAYNAVLDRQAKGELVVGREEVVWSEAKESFMVYVRWQAMYQEFGNLVEGDQHAGG